MKKELFLKIYASTEKKIVFQTLRRFSLGFIEFQLWSLQNVQESSKVSEALARLTEINRAKHRSARRCS